METDHSRLLLDLRDVHRCGVMSLVDAFDNLFLVLLTYIVLTDQRHFRQHVAPRRCYEVDSMRSQPY